MVVGGGVLWGRSYEHWELRNQLMRISPLCLEINFFLLGIAVLLNVKRFKAVISQISKRTWICLFLIVLGGTLLTIFVAPRIHRIMYDEDIYLNVGQNIAYLDKAAMCNNGRHLYGEYQCYGLEYNKEPNGWPYLISLISRIIPSAHVSGFLLNNFMRGGSILIVFFIGYFLFQDEAVGLFGSLVFALIPDGIRWGNTAAAEPGAAFWAGLALLAVLVFVRHPETTFLFLAALLLPFAFQFRPESGMILLPVGLLILFMVPGELKQKRFYAALLLLLALALPHFIHLYAVRHEGWGVSAGGSKFALQHFQTNFKANFFFYVNNTRFPVLFTLFFLTGIGSPLLKNRHNKYNKPVVETRGTLRAFLLQEKLVVLSWFLAFWGIFLFFYAGSYTNGVGVRFAQVSYIPLSILAGFGAVAFSKWCLQKFHFEWVLDGLIFLAALSFINFLPYIRVDGQEAWDSRADHEYAEQIAQYLPPHSLLLTHNPNMFLLWGKNAGQTSMATHNPQYMESLFQQYPGGIYFHFNYWCTVQNEVQQTFCKNIIKKFKSTEVVSFQEQHKVFQLYKIELK